MGKGQWHVVTRHWIRVTHQVGSSATGLDRLRSHVLTASRASASRSTMPSRGDGRDPRSLVAESTSHPFSASHQLRYGSSIDWASCARASRDRWKAAVRSSSIGTPEFQELSIPTSIMRKTINGSIIGFLPFPFAYDTI